MKYYICGPMTGIPAFNIPLFDFVAATLREQGYEVVSPAELDDQETRRVSLASPDGQLHGGKVNGSTWGDFLSRDVKLVADDIDRIVLLPGWEKSRGARLEVFVGLLCRKQFSEWTGTGRFNVAEHWVRRVLQENMP